MSALPPGSIIGIMGGGQLGRMLAVAASRLGLKTRIYTDSPGPASDVSLDTTIGDYDDIARVAAFAKSVDAVTFEFENVPVAAALEAQNSAPVRPNAKALEVAQDRAVEKDFITSLGIPVAPFQNIATPDQLVTGWTALNTPAILKTSRLGYDGKGQVRVDNQPDAQAAHAILAKLANAPCVLEARVAFQFEVSVLLVRGLDGQVLFYDIPQNTHKNGILDTSSVPSNLPADMIARAHDIARTIGHALDYVGVLAVEMFYLGPDSATQLIVNEIAPRVHNSGHWTLDACAVSQFENQIRAVAGWPLGDTRRHSNAVMTNLIGDDINAWQDLARESNNGIHIYGKNQARKGRKMGHVTRLSPASHPAKTRTKTRRVC